MSPSDYQCDHEAMMEWAYPSKALSPFAEAFHAASNPCPKCGTLLWGEQRPCWWCARLAALEVS